MPAIALESDGAGGGYIELGVEDFPVASAMGYSTFDDGHDLIPFLRLVLLEILPRTGQNVVAALELGLAYEYTAVRIWRCPKLEL